MSLSVIIVNYNTQELLKNCLESIFRHTRDLDFEVIVVDNGSEDGSVESIKQLANYELRVKNKKNNSQSVTRNQAIVKLIENKKNLGFAGGNNLGIKQAQGKYILLLNSDTLLKNNAFLKMVKFMEEHPGVSALGPRLLNSDGSLQASVGRFPTLPVAVVMLFKEHFGGSRFVRYSPEKTSEVDWAMGAAIMARRKVFEKIGFLDEKMFMYMEEVEWCYQVNKTGGKIMFYPDAEIIHFGGGSSKTGRKDPILNIYKGLIYFYQKHKSPMELVVLRSLLKLKAGGSFLLGYLTNNNYLKETYGEAFKIS